MKTLLIVLFTLMVLMLVIDPVLRTSVRCFYSESVYGG